jgi:D-beta-D-heptose 7-phosphate kinase/D-beta-D-heptose 1-phosphate adenosyltransferase
VKSKVLQQITARFPGKRVIVVGDVMLDEYIWGAVRRISPEAPVPVVEMQRRTYVPGGAANTATNLANLGGEVCIGGVVGTDQEGKHLAHSLQVAGVDSSGLVDDPNRPTTTKTRIIAHSQQVVRVDHEQILPLEPALEDRLWKWIRARIVDSDVCVLSDYAKGVLSPRFTERVIELVAEVGLPVVIDPKGTDYSKYRGATVIKPNKHEVERVLGRELRGEADWLAAARQLLELLPGTSLLISRGPEGLSVFRRGMSPVHIPSAAREVFDVTGAGDTVVSALALALAAGASLEQGAHLANRAAGIVVGKVGTTAVTLEELQGHLRVRREKRRSLVGQVTP